jgi:hypothetical protein
MPCAMPGPSKPLRLRPSSRECASRFLHAVAWCYWWAHLMAQCTPRRQGASQSPALRWSIALRGRLAFRATPSCCTRISLATLRRPSLIPKHRRSKRRNSTSVFNSRRNFGAASSLNHQSVSQAVSVYLDIVWRNFVRVSPVQFRMQRRPPPHVFLIRCIPPLRHWFRSMTLQGLLRTQFAPGHPSKRRSHHLQRSTDVDSAWWLPRPWASAVCCLLRGSWDGRSFNADSPLRLQWPLSRLTPRRQLKSRIQNPSCSQPRRSP